MEQLKIMIEPRFPVLILMFPNWSITERGLIPAKINRKGNDNYSMVFEGLASLCFRKRKPCQNPIQTQELTFYFGKFHCQTPQKPCSLSTLQIINKILNPNLNYNGKYDI